MENLGPDFVEVGPDEVWLRGTRVGVEIVLQDYLYFGLSAEEIAEQYRTVTLEQVKATIALWEADRKRWTRYLESYREAARQARAQAALDDSPVMQRLRRLKAILDEYPEDQRREVLQRLVAEEREANTAATEGASVARAA